MLKAIELGRRGKDNENDMHEALRLLGQVSRPFSHFPSLACLIVVLSVIVSSIILLI